MKSVLFFLAGKWTKSQFRPEGKESIDRSLMKMQEPVFTVYLEKNDEGTFF